jgi:recombination protein RecR
VKDQVSFCRVCNNITEKEVCSICSNPKRDTQKVLVVEEPSTLYAIERTGEHKGTYHVLLGGLSPLPGKTTPEPPFQGLVDRVEKGGISEVILATNPTIEGEATAIYITRLLKPYDVTVTRIACGIPVGIDLEYVDEVTLAKSLQGRRVIE